jgi:hypothetical protein
MKSGKSDISTTSGLTSSLQRKHLALATSRSQQHTEKPISLDLKNGKKTYLSI